MIEAEEAVKQKMKGSRRIFAKAFDLLTENNF